MNHRIFKYYSVLTFNENDFDKINNKIRKSRIYTHYIDSSKGRGISNVAYAKYLKYKQYLYTREYRYCKNSDIKLIFSNLPKEDIEKINEIKESFTFDEYYTVENRITNFEDNKIIQNYIELIENTVIERTKNLDEFIQKFEIEYYRKNFISKGKQRYFILPFVGKINSQIVEPVVILNIYDVGIITLDIMIGYDFDEMAPLKNNDTFIKLDEVKLYKIKEKYSKADYFETKILKNIGINKLEDYYIELLEKVTNVNFIAEEDFAQTANIIGSFNTRSNKSSLNDFISENIEKLAQYTKNSNYDIIKTSYKNKIEERLIDNVVFDRLNLKFIVGKTFSLLVMNDYLYDENIKDAFLENEELLKEKNLYDNMVYKAKKEMLYNRLFDFYCCYELSLIRKYYSRQLFNNLIKNKEPNHSNLVENKRLLDLVKLKYDEDIIFRFGGSPKNLYMKINENNGSNLYIKKSEKALMSLYNDISEIENIKRDRFNNTILIFTSIFSVLLGFTGIKEIVYNVLVNVPIETFNIIRLHPLRTTVLLWIIFILVLFMIVRRQKG